MHDQRCLIRLICVLSVLLPGPGFLAHAEPDGGRSSKKVRVLTLEGTPHARGFQHGAALKKEIHELVRLWKVDLESEYKIDAPTFIQRFLKKTDYLAAVKRWTPELIDEIRGIADGAGLDFDTMFLFQLADEYWVNGEAIAANRCTGMGMSRQGKHPTCIAQNLDVESFRDGYQILLHIKHQGSDLESFVLSFPGLIGANGMNNKSIGICCNTLSQLANCRDGLPVNCIIRGVLEQRSYADAVGFLHRVKHASGQNYIVGGPERAASFECSAGKVVEFKPAGREGVVWHTNHPLVNDEYNAEYRAALGKEKTKKPNSSSVRLRCVEQRLSKAPLPWDLDVFKATLSSNDSREFPVSVPHTKGPVFTFASTIMVLAENPELYIAPGPPEVTPYERLSFRRSAGK